MPIERLLDISKKLRIYFVKRFLLKMSNIKVYKIN